MSQSTVLLALLLIIKLCYATIKVNFTHDEFNQYTASIAGQEFLIDERGTKVFGKHPPGQKSSDVKVIDCAEKGNHFELFPPMLSSIFGEAEVLLLQNSGIKKLTYESFVHTRKVKIIMFAKDNFVIEPAVFRECKELEVLKFDDLDLSNVNVEAFEGIESLKILSVKNCEITRMEPELLEPLENLIELHITQNPMQVPPISAIQRMTHLRVLNLSGNKLTHLHDDLFKNKEFLEYVDVSKNIIHEVERDILLHWPSHATINMEENICINKKFDHIGTDSLTLSDVANDIMPCFGDNNEETSASISAEYSIEKSTENGSSEFTDRLEETRGFSSSESSESSKGKRSEFLEKLLKPIKSEESPKKISNFTEENKFEVFKNNSRSPNKEMAKKSAEHDEIKITEIKESKLNESAEIQTVKNLKESLEIQRPKNSKVSNEKKDKISKENVSEEKITNANKSIEKILDDDNLSEKEKEKKIEEMLEAKIEESDHDVEVVATISPFEFIEQEESSDVAESTLRPYEAILEIEETEGDEKLSTVIEGEKIEETTEKKRKIKNKKNKKSTTETPETSEETAKFSELPEPATNFLHPYEQAYCRFFIDADNKYNCVLENITSEIKLIKTEHLSGYDNSKIAGLFLRQSVLVRLPAIFFDTFENLEHLSVENTNLKQLDEDTVKDGCGKLKTISLKHNKIRRLERHALKECENLEEIDLTGNPLEYLEGDIFNYNPKLSIQMGSLKIVAPALTSF